MQRDDMKDLLWFLAVARERSFTKAAAKLGTSQSTLSHTIKQLEARLAVRIGPDWRLVAVASPDYFARRPVPRTPQDLVGHSCINMRQTAAGGLYAWEFEKKRRELRVRVDGQMTFNSSIPMIDAAISG